MTGRKVPEAVEAVEVVGVLEVETEAVEAALVLPEEPLEAEELPEVPLEVSMLPTRRPSLRSALRDGPSIPGLDALQ